MDILEVLKENAYLITIGVILTAIIIAIINRKSQQKGKRIDAEKIAIVELITEIHHSTFDLQFGTYSVLPGGGGSGGSGGHTNLNLFQIQQYENATDNSEYNNAPVFFEMGSSIILDFKTHIRKPTMPKKIKKILKKFHNDSFVLFQNNQDPVEFDYVAIESGRFIEMTFLKNNNDTRFKLGNAIAYQSYLSFVTCCIELENGILKWSSWNKAGLSIENNFD